MKNHRGVVYKDPDATYLDLILKTLSRDSSSKRSRMSAASSSDRYPTAPQGFPSPTVSDALLDTEGMTPVHNQQHSPEHIQGQNQLLSQRHNEHSGQAHSQHLGRARSPQLERAQSQLQNHTRNRVFSAAGGSSTTAQAEATSAKKGGIPQNEFQKQVLRQLHIIRLMIEQQQDVLNNLPAIQKECVAPCAVLQEPIDNLEDFKHFDETVEEVKGQLLSELKGLGGKNVTIATKKILTYIMTDNVAQHYSWVGNKGKEKFCNVNVRPLIVDAARSNKSFVATVDETEAVIKKWLQHARDRVKLQEERVAKKAVVSEA
ncbi:uncharacterized protein LOC135376945 isoform X2 [Ornithodoros turicata]|uniref:uncharacterized protein LOC135376945 isoform X2 n=1 Tax=Ornithodoros turicata TaxID=34597 RepID=UPI003139E3C8